VRLDPNLTCSRASGRAPSSSSIPIETLKIPNRYRRRVTLKLPSRLPSSLKSV
jgi:hypothetical protein